MNPSPRQVKKAKKIYEELVNHLIEEGYASTKADADNVISGMSEEWFNMIVND
jgi:hypothetical protein|tara:strand:+ start:1211 stop:1369 length:159 start_codon:yes stop_codon:yes gene_type:complete